MAYLKRYKNERTQIEINIIKETSTKTTSVRKKSEAKMELKGPPFGLYEITMFCPQDHVSSMMESRQWHSGTHDGIDYSSFNHQSVFSKTIRGGNGHRGGESSVVVVKKEKPPFMTPDWMEERPSPETMRRNPEVLDINILLKYPGGNVPKRNAPDLRRVQYESTIRPEVAKRDSAVPVLPVKKEKPEFVTPEWMEERPSPETKRRNPEDLDINILLKYPNGYVSRRNAPDPMKVQYESTIHPEVAKRDNSIPVLAVQREKRAFVTPEWMEERSSPETRRRNPDVLDINSVLKYSNCYVPKLVSPDPRKVQYESTIRPEIAKRDNSVPLLQDFEDDEEEEYDEFEEVIVIVDVRRKPVWHRGLELPKAEQQKVGVSIQDLLQLPTRRVKRESAQDKLSIDNNGNDITIIDEKIESVQRPAVVQEAQALASIFQGL